MAAIPGPASSPPPTSDGEGRSVTATDPRFEAAIVRPNPHSRLLGYLEQAIKNHLHALEHARKYAPPPGKGGKEATDERKRIAVALDKAEQELRNALAYVEGE